MIAQSAERLLIVCNLKADIDILIENPVCVSSSVRLNLNSLLHYDDVFI